jgi:hypothetical protein
MIAQLSMMEKIVIMVMLIKQKEISKEGEMGTDERG